jgi:hypothetical protein
MKVIFAPPAADELIRVLRAWRFWLLGAIVGALCGAAVYYLVPPSFRARATVNVDFHLEQAWPQNADREQFYYLERETRKLQEVAMSDTVLSAVAAQVSGTSLAGLRGGQLTLSQPGNGGWHFYADDRDPKRAAALAAAWAEAFANQIQKQVAAAPAGGLEPFITADPVQVDGLVAQRTLGVSLYLIAGAIVFLALAILIVLFVHAAP